MTQFRVHVLEDCLLNPPKKRDAFLIGAAVLGAVGPKLIKTAIVGLANALKKAGEAETEQLTADEFKNLYLADDKQALSINPELGCVLGVWFDEPHKHAPADDAVARTLKENALVPGDAAVGGVFEAAIRAMPDGTAFYLETRYFSVRAFTGDRGNDDRAYVVTLGLVTPSATSEGTTFALGRINLGRRTPKDGMEPGEPDPRYRSNLMPWGKISEASKASYERDVAARRAAGRQYMPVTFSLTVSETEDGNKFLLKLGEVLGELADAAASEISKQILPAEIEKAAAEEAAGAEKLYEEELKAELEVRKAQKAYDIGAEADKPTLKVALEIARRKLAWQKSLRQAAGLADRAAVDLR